MFGFSLFDNIQMKKSLVLVEENIILVNDEVFSLYFLDEFYLFTVYVDAKKEEIFSVILRRKVSSGVFGMNMREFFV